MMKQTRRKHIKYVEGQWFAVPLNDGGYALGVIVRGNYRTKGGLGYFFGPRYDRVPDDRETWRKRPEEAVLIAWFGDLGIVQGAWPLIPSTRPFQRAAWPVPTFHRIDSLDPTIGWRVEYSQDINGLERPLRETLCDARDLAGLPKDSLFGDKAIEAVLTKLLAPTSPS